MENDFEEVLRAKGRLCMGSEFRRAGWASAGGDVTRRERSAASGAGPPPAVASREAGPQPHWEGCWAAVT